MIHKAELTISVAHNRIYKIEREARIVPRLYFRISLLAVD
jgi:hypothetical protein